jgi:hypothetical protein
MRLFRRTISPISQGPLVKLSISKLVEPSWGGVTRRISCCEVIDGPNGSIHNGGIGLTVHGVVGKDPEKSTGE